MWQQLGLFSCNTHTSQYPQSTTKGTRISVLKIAKIGVNFREILRSVKVEKRVLFLSENL